MTSYIGEYHCTVDDKSRMMLPAGLLKQLPKKLQKKFVINRSVFQQCLVLHPMDSWEDTMKELLKLNRFVKKNDDFIRQYTNGGMTIDMDATNRLLLPKHLSDYAKIKRDVVLTASLNKIEIWSAKVYKEVMAKYDSDAFGSLAEDVMGNKTGDKSE